MKEKILSVAESMKLDCVGFTSADLYNRATGDNYKTAVVVLFPYYCGDVKESNLSKYTYSNDYHTVCVKKLNELAETCGIKDYKAFSDTGPEIDRTLALNCGLCFKGLSGMCINHTYGSYFFIGYFVCDVDVEYDKPLKEECLKCEKCIAVCPGNALSGGFCEEICLSYITQKKGELTPNEENLIKKSKMIFGCDTCQDVCPHNENIRHTPIEEFKTDLIYNLSSDDIENLSNKEFRNRYGNRAFSWRGKQVLLRNLKITK